MKDLNLYGFVALIIVLVGGIDLGLYGLLGVNLLSAIFGNLIGRLLFIVMGAAAGYLGYLIYLEKFKKST